MATAQANMEQRATRVAILDTHIGAFGHSQDRTNMFPTIMVVEMIAITSILWFTSLILPLG